LGESAQGYSEYRHEETGMVFVLLPGGTFLMGAQSEDPGRAAYDPRAWPDEAPVREVTLAPFLIAKYEVTQGEWEAVMGSNPSWFQDDRVPAGVDASRLPVESVSWDDIQTFEERTGLGLPTEAQWEYACRAGTQGAYSGTGDLDDMGWYSENSEARTHVGGEKLPNAFGLHDFHGNVWEWCEDVYDMEFYSRPEAAQPDPLSGSGSVIGVFRGGNWTRPAPTCRSAHRLGDHPDARRAYLGFRPIRLLN
jgi:formylglycine-generating enzyme required for sulfatase activity